MMAWLLFIDRDGYRHSVECSGLYVAERDSGTFAIGKPGGNTYFWHGVLSIEATDSLDRVNEWIRRK